MEERDTRVSRQTVYVRFENKCDKISVGQWRREDMICNACTLVEVVRAIVFAKATTTLAYSGCVLLLESRIAEGSQRDRFREENRSG